MISEIHSHQNTIETGMNLYVHTRTMKIVLSTKDPPPQGLSEARWTVSFF